MFSVLSSFFPRSLEHLSSSSLPVCDLAVLNSEVDSSRLFSYLYSETTGNAAQKKKNSDAHNSPTEKFCRSTSLAALIWTHPEYERKFLEKLLEQGKTSEKNLRWELLAPISCYLEKNRNSEDLGEISKLLARSYFVSLVKFLISGEYPKTYSGPVNFLFRYSLLVVQNILRSKYVLLSMRGK
jgi:hypothetical protein